MPAFSVPEKLKQERKFPVFRASLGHISRLVSKIKSKKISFINSYKDNLQPMSEV